MTSRELVKRTLEFDGPERVARHLWALPWADYNHPKELEQIRAKYPDDIVMPPTVYKDQPVTKGDQYAVGFYTDEWGCEFENKQAGIIGEVRQPMLKDLAEWEKVHPPREMLSFDADKINEFCAKTDKFVLSSCFPRPFERMQFIRGSAQLYMDIAMVEPEFVKLLDRVHQFFLEELRAWAKTDVDALFIMDDWGSQQSLLISPKQWREIFKPLYKDYADIAHSNGKKIFMHSDGYILDIVPDLIEVGIDAINSQIFCIGIEKLEQFKGKITFWGEIDRQHILPSDNVEEVIAAVAKVRKHLYDNGGVIAQCEFGPGSKCLNVETVFEEWNKVKV